MAFGLVRRPTAKERQTLGEPPGRLLGSQDADPRARGELDRERKAVERTTDAADRVCVLVAELELGERTRCARST